MSQQDEKYQPKTLLWREPDYSVHLQQVLGKLDFDTNFDNEFQKFELAMNLVLDVQEAIKQKNIDLEDREDLLLSKSAIEKLDKLWHGQTFYANLINDNGFFTDNAFIVYGMPPKTYDGFDVEAIPLPQLRNMKPVRAIKEDTLLIQIREKWWLKYAFEGTEYSTLVNDGDFAHYLQDGVFPKITRNDMHSTSKKTYFISRSNYHDLMSNFTEQFNKNFVVFSNNVQKLITFLKTGQGKITDTDKEFKLFKEKVVSEDEPTE